MSSKLICIKVRNRTIVQFHHSGCFFLSLLLFLGSLPERFRCVSFVWVSSQLWSLLEWVSSQIWCSQKASWQTNPVFYILLWNMKTRNEKTYLAKKKPIQYIPVFKNHLGILLPYLSITEVEYLYSYLITFPRKKNHSFFFYWYLHTCDISWMSLLLSYRPMTLCYIRQTIQWTQFLLRN